MSPFALAVVDPLAADQSVANLTEELASAIDSGNYIGIVVVVVALGLVVGRVLLKRRAAKKAEDKAEAAVPPAPTPGGIGAIVDVEKK